MSVYTTTIIQCNNCCYEYPNDYYHGKRDWIEFTTLGDDEKLHFCSQGCVNRFVELNPEIIFTDKKEIDNLYSYLIIKNNE